jgi:predicted ATPase
MEVRIEPASGAFVGREREQGQLAAGLDAALEGLGSLYLLVGEPGIGKSRLADEVASIARAKGFRVLWGRCWEAGGAPAYWPWVQSLRSYVREAVPTQLADDLGPGGGTSR